MQVIETGGYDGMSAILYGPPSHNMLNYLQQQYETAATMLQGVNNDFLNVVTNTYRNVTDPENIKKAMEVVNKAGGTMWDDIPYIITYDTIPYANAYMRDVIMATPIVYEMYNQNLLNGYNGLVSDNDTLEILRNNISSGVSTSDDSVRTDGIIFEDSHMMEMDDYTHNILLDSWRVATEMIAHDVDPTSPTLESL